MGSFKINKLECLKISLKKALLRLQEALEKHREIKKDMLRLLEICENPNTSKHTIKNELFKIYKEIR